MHIKDRRESIGAVDRFQIFAINRDRNLRQVVHELVHKVMVSTELGGVGGRTNSQRFFRRVL